MNKYELAGLLALPQVWDRLAAEWEAIRYTDCETCGHWLDAHHGGYCLDCHEVCDVPR